MTSTGRPWSEPTLWPEDTPASPSAPQAAEEVKTIPDTSGHSSPSAFAFYDLDTHSWRTSQATFLWDSDLYWENWPRSGMTYGGIAYQLRPSAPLTAATAYSLSQGSHGPNSDGLWPTATTQDHATRYAQGGMPLGMAARLWPTPTANGWGSTGHQQMLQPRVENGEISQEEKRRMVQGHGGHLNPTWVEWLMGFPTGWTDLED